MLASPLASQEAMCCSLSTGPQMSCLGRGSRTRCISAGMLQAGNGEPSQSLQYYPTNMCFMELQDCLILTVLVDLDAGRWLQLDAFSYCTGYCRPRVSERAECRSSSAKLLAYTAGDWASASSTHHWATFVFSPACLKMYWASLLGRLLTSVLS
uniref:Uncharacterized protein n=1 Tax=Setaria italica TaxID=4555 RepID=K3ZXP6_SETIT